MNLDQDLVTKLETLEAIEELDEYNEESLNRLESFSRDETAEVRYRAAEALVFADPAFSDGILLRLLEDEDELVRVNAADSLCRSVSLDVLEALKRHAVDDAPLVRGYAVMSISDIRKNVGGIDEDIRNFLKDLNRKERNSWVKVHYYLVLYELGVTSCLRNLMHSLNSKNYRIRIVAAKSLAEIVNNDNQNAIREALSARLKLEDAFAVIDCIEKLLINII